MNRIARVLSVAVVLCVLCLASGCLATDMVENRTRNELQLQGWEVSPRNPDVFEFTRITPAEQLKAGVAPTITRYAITQAAGDLHPWLYGGAKVIDYGVLPVAGGLATYYGYQAMTGGGNSSSKATTIYADHGGTVTINHGPGSANSTGPATTTTSTSSTGL